MAVLSRWSVVLVVSALTLAGCSSSGAASHPRADDCPGAVSSASCPQHEPPREQSGPLDVGARGPVTIRGGVKGGTVTVLTHAGLRGTLDPTGVHAADVLSIDRGLVTRSLTQYSYDRQSHSMRLVPDLATTVGTHNGDYTLWAFDIRAGVRFENGAPVTAKDVVRGIRACLHAAALPVGPCRHYADVIRSVEVKHHEVYVHLRRPFPDLPYLGALPELGPLPAPPTDSATSRRYPLATGPYRIESYHRGRRLVLVRNPEWDPRTDPVRTQYPDSYDFRAGRATQRIEQTLLHDTGTGQTTLTYDNLSAHAFRSLRGTSMDRLVLGGLPCTTYVAPDNRSVTSRGVRQALALAYPYRAMVRLDGGIPGVTALAATNLTPPGTSGRTAYPARDRVAFGTQPRAARSLLQRSHALGAEIRFGFVPGVATSMRQKQVLARALDAAGFRAVPVAVPTTRAAHPEVDLRTETRCGDWTSESAWLPALFGSTLTERTGGLGENLAAFSQPSVDRELTGIRRRPLEQQDRAYNRLEHQILRRWFPEFPVSYGGVDMAHGSRINGMADDYTVGMPTWQDLWVAP